ncbi:unnamed protein product, partial [Urochloa humidicola]
ARRQARTLEAVRSGRAADLAAERQSRGCACGASCGRRSEVRLRRPLRQARCVSSGQQVGELRLQLLW